MVHADRRLDTWPLREEMTELIEKLPHGKLISFIEDEETGDYRGRVDIAKLGVPAEANVYLCGPLPFMKACVPLSWMQMYRRRISIMRSLDRISGCCARKGYFGVACAGVFRGGWVS